MGPSAGAANLQGCNPMVDEATLGKARELFDADVLPVLQSRCASCHAGANTIDGPDFMGAGAADYHDTLVANRQLVNTPKNSLLVLKGAHSGPALSPGEAKSTRDWIQLRSGGDCATATTGDLNAPTDTKPTTLEDALERFGKCMHLLDWENTNAASIALQSSSEGPCRGCHNAGLAGVWMSSDPAAMWEINRKQPYLLKWIGGSFGADGTLSDLIPSGRLCAKGDESLRCQGATSCHPKFSCSPQVLTAIKTFLEVTLKRYQDYATDC